MPISTFQLRADQELLSEMKIVANQRHISANRFLVEAILEALKRDKEQEWRTGFEAMGRDADTNDVEYLLPAASEVVLGS